MKNQRIMRLAGFFLTAGGCVSSGLTMNNNVLHGPSQDLTVEVINNHYAPVIVRIAYDNKSVELAPVAQGAGHEHSVSWSQLGAFPGPQGLRLRITLQSMTLGAPVERMAFRAYPGQTMEIRVAQNLQQSIVRGR